MTEKINQDDVNIYLDELRDSGITNMFGAGSYVQKEFGININEAHDYLSEWMKTFDDRHPND